MRIEILMSKLFGFSTQTYFNWKKNTDDRKILLLLEKYFTKEDLEEFLNNSKISKIEDSYEKDLFYSIALNEYSIYINEIISSSLNEIEDLSEITTHQDKSYESYLFNHIPIFILFEYVNTGSIFEFRLEAFPKDIMDIYTKYNINNLNTNYLQKIFNINLAVVETLDYFNRQKSFSFYYKYCTNISDEDNKNIFNNQHAFFNIIYLKIKNIQSLNISQTTRDKMLFEVINSHKYNQKKNYIFELKQYIP